MNGQGGVMRLYAIITAVLAAVTIVGLSSEVHVYAETTNNINNSSSASGAAIKYVTVLEGDCLSTIAASNNTTYQRIFDANQKIVNPDLIYPGEVLVIPSPNEQLNNRALPDNTIADTAPVDSVEQPVAPISSPAPQTPITAPAPTNSVAPENLATEQPTPAANSSLNVWYSLAQCESSGNWSIDTGNGFYGGLQFTLSSWQSVGGTGYPNMASPSEQIMRAELLQQQQGWGAWPVCSAELGL